MMQLFKLIQGTDVFEKFYKIRLEKRLLLEKSYSNELEKAMLGKLKTVRLTILKLLFIHYL